MDLEWFYVFIENTDANTEKLCVTIGMKIEKLYVIIEKIGMSTGKFRMIEKNTGVSIVKMHVIVEKTGAGIE